MKILFTFKEFFATFMKWDEDILAISGKVIRYNFPEIKRKGQLMAFIRQFWHLLTTRYDVYFCYFADYHSVLPVLFAKILRKKSIVIVAGYDAYGIKDKNYTYGLWTAPAWRRMAAKIVYRYADHILPVSKGLLKELNQYTRTDDRYKPVLFGYNAGEFMVEEKENFVLMVALADREATYYRKGYDRAFRLAETLPEVRFIFIGLQWRPDEREHKNVVIIPELPYEGVKKVMAVAKMFLQPSRAEGMCNTLAEAMLSGCHIISSNITGMNEVYQGGISEYIWNKNMYVDRYIPERVKACLKATSPAMENRQYIIDNFTVERREKALLKIILDK